MEGPDIRRIGVNDVSNTAREDVTEQAETSAEYGIGCKLPRDRCSRLQNCKWSGSEQLPKMSLDGGVQRLIHIMRDGIERATKTGDVLVGIQWIGIQRMADTEGPGQFRSHFPRVLRVQVQIEEVERLVGRKGKSLRRGRRHSVDELRQGAVGDRGNRPFAEIVVIQSKDSGVRSKPELVSPAAPREIVIDEEPRGASSLDPSVVESPECGKGCICTAALQHNRKCG